MKISTEIRATYIPPGVEGAWRGERIVDIPDSYKDGTAKDRLGAVWYYGQNDFQPQEKPSLCVGDLIRLPGEGTWEIMLAGFRKIAEGEGAGA